MEQSGAVFLYAVISNMGEGRAMNVGLTRGDEASESVELQPRPARGWRAFR